MRVRRFEDGVLVHEEALPEDQIKVRGKRVSHRDILCEISHAQRGTPRGRS